VNEPYDYHRHAALARELAKELKVSELQSQLLGIAARLEALGRLDDEVRKTAPARPRDAR